MSIILELRRHCNHGSTILLNPRSEDVLLANVFGVIRNLPVAHVLVPWLHSVTGLRFPDEDWAFSFWESQPVPDKSDDGSTKVDLIVESGTTLVFIEVKLEAPISQHTTNDDSRNQLVRNLDVGYNRASSENKRFAFIFVTCDEEEPHSVKAVRSGIGSFLINPEIDPALISCCIRWAPWSSIGNVVSEAYTAMKLLKSESGFALDLLAYLALKSLWRNILPDEPRFSSDKLLEPLRHSDSKFGHYRNHKPERYQGWREKAWPEALLRQKLALMRVEDQAFLNMLALAGGTMRQDEILRKFPALRGKGGGSLRSLKKHINEVSRACDCAALLSDGIGMNGSRRHSISSKLGDLRRVVIEVASTFDIDWGLLGGNPNDERTK